MNYFIIGDEDSVLGFGMVGVSGRIATNRQEAEAAFEQVLADKSTAIILITERVAELVREQVDQLIFTREFPLILEIPDRLGKIEGKPGLREMVNNAIGVKL